MKRILQENAKSPYYYHRFDFDELNNYNIQDIILNIIDINDTTNFSSKTNYIKLYSGFDIETTNINKLGTMYKWQLSLNTHVISGRTYDQFIETLNIIKKYYSLSNAKHLIIWVANLGYEWQFIRKWLNVTDYFFKDSRKPLYIVHDNCIEFREALGFVGNSLKSLAKAICNTQKLDGDLDYNIMRNKNTILSEQEERYCDNDVLILSEFSEWFFEKYLINKRKCFIPLTIQSVIRHQQQEQALRDYPNIKDIIQFANFNETDYHKYMLWLFRGGITHGSIKYADEILTEKYKIDSADITSSYPASMLQCYYPYSFETVPIDTPIDNNHCWIIECVFDNITSTTAHSLESKSKCLYLESPIIDNGRVRRAKKLKVILTELDYLSYQKFYKWENMTIISLKRSIKIKLPRYVIDYMLINYTKKNKLKKEGLDYSFQKSVVNSSYGVLVTRLSETNIEYQDGEYLEMDAGTYYKLCANNVLLPQWGIWVTAHSRFRLVSMIYDIETKTQSEVIYYDTDSIYYTNKESCKTLICNFNNKIQALNREICAKYNLDYDVFNDLGCFDSQSENGKKPYQVFKYLGAKRYIYIQGGQFKQTVAGLPKGKLLEIAKKAHLKNKRFDIFKEFRDNLLITESDKLVSNYIDDEFTVEIDGVTQYEKSAIGLYETSFTMHLDEKFIELIEKFKTDYKNKEKR